MEYTIKNYESFNLLLYRAQVLVDSAISLKVAKKRSYRTITDHKELNALGFASRQLRCVYCSHLISIDDDAQHVSKREYAHTACAFRVNDEFFAALDSENKEMSKNDVI
jgi:hypothetical protein